MRLTKNEAAVIRYMLTEAMDAVCARELADAREQYCAPCDAQELAHAAGISTGQVRGVLASLLLKGVLTHDNGNIERRSEFWLTDDAFEVFAHLVP